MKNYQVYHKHTSASHRYNKDSPLTLEDYLKYFDSDEMKDKPQIYSCMEHGWQGNYFKIYNKIEAFNKNREKHNQIKFIFGTEAYWVKDKSSNDSSNCHIVLLAMNDNGRKKINRAIYESFKDGYYYKNRMDIDTLLSLPKSDVFVTSACLSYWKSYAYNKENNSWNWKDIDEITLKLFNHFDNFYLEVQANNTDWQRKINKHIIELHNKYSIPIIAGTDSHVIVKEQERDRDDLLRSNKITYEEESGCYMDVPSYDELVRRFKEQGVLSNDKIIESIENTNLILGFEDIILDRSIKVPIAKQCSHLESQEERNEILREILFDEWELQKSDINESKIDEYMSELQNNLKEIIDCNMADYFIVSYLIAKLAREKYGGVLTNSGRGSAVSYLLNKLLRLTNVDKVNSPVIMYAERFITKERILESKTLPDIDWNVGTREPFILAQNEVVGSESFDLLAIGTLKYKSAFKMYSRAYNLDPQLANEVSKQINKYETAMKYAEEDEKEFIDIFDYVDKEKYGYLIDGCSQYMGIIDILKAHPCGVCCYDGDVIEDIGVIMVKSESSSKQNFIVVIESDTIDSFGFLKQDYLIVDSVGLIDSIYNEIGIKQNSINETLKIIENNKKTWDIYKDGLTVCVNQCEQDTTIKKVIKYQPKNISELTQFIAGIRPSFKSMYKKFENREHFSYGIKAFDDLIQDEYCDSSFILYQEHLMKVLGFAGFPMKDTYTIIKAISKKKKQVINDAKGKFVENFAKSIIDTKETNDVDKANEMANKVWRVIEDSASYGFNCVSGDTKLFRGRNGKFEPTIEEMYNIMNDYQYAKRTKHESLHSKYKKNGYGTCMSMKDGIIFENKIVDIYKQNVAMTYKMKTREGREIVCTENHKFETNRGILKLKEITCGDFVYCMGKYKKKNKNFNLTDLKKPNNTPKKGEIGFQKKEYSAHNNFKNFLFDCKNRKDSCAICGGFGRMEVHHKDFNRKNNNFDNFIYLCASCHKKEHYKNGRTKRYENGIETYLDEIISIEKESEIVVYDVEMSGDVAHNFVLDNGMVTCNSAHAYSMALDSVTLAYLKAHYPLEFYKASLQRYNDKNNKDKISKLKKELSHFNIELEKCKFGDDNRTFSINREENKINQTMASIKDMQKMTPDILYEIGLSCEKNLFAIFYEIYNSAINKKSMDILIKIDYFSEFGDFKYIEQQWNVFNEFISIMNKFKDCSQLKKDYIESIGLDCEIIGKFCGKETAKLFKDIDNEKLVEYLLSDKDDVCSKIELNYPYESPTNLMIVSNEVKLLGFTNIIDNSIDINTHCVLEVEQNAYGTRFLTLYNIYNGFTYKYKVKKQNYIEVEVGDIIECAFRIENKRIKNDEGKWIESGEVEKILYMYAKSH